MRQNREFKKEQFTKSLNIISKDDDISEVLFKMFEQVRLINDDITSHINVQKQKKDSIRNLESVLMTEDNYNDLLAQVKAQDAVLYEIS